MFKFKNIKIGKKFIIVPEPAIGPQPVFIKVSETHAVRLCDGETMEVLADQACFIVLL